MLLIRFFHACARACAISVIIIIILALPVEQGEERTMSLPGAVKVSGVVGIARVDCQGSTRVARVQSRIEPEPAKFGSTYRRLRSFSRRALLFTPLSFSAFKKTSPSLHSLLIFTRSCRRAQVAITRTHYILVVRVMSICCYVTPPLIISLTCI